ncbi:MAG: hypothetical protein LBS75_09230 [Synergistaceae bacterium]|jgi:hypothetical protein|nr:hypothetical protein [Synergistaceae bacterium]
MRYLKFFAYAAAAMAALVAGVFFFAPWDMGGMYVLDSIRLEAAKRGVYISYGGMRAEGTIFPVYRIDSVDIESPVSKMTVSDVKVKTRFLASLLSGRASFAAEFGGTDILVIPNNRVNLQRGEADISAAGDAISVSGADIEGEISATGDIVYDIAQRRVTYSTIAIKAPPHINALLGNPLLSRYLESANPGEWRIKSNASQNRP